MPNNYDISFTHTHQLMDDGAIAFKCARDVKQWPWLELPSSHPIVVQTINYWASVETGKTRGTFDPTKWSALTYTKWQAGSASAGPVTHGLADLPPGPPEKDRPGFRLTFFDAAGNLVCRMIGSGVIFQTRDFEAWRSEAKDEAKSAPSTEAFTYASAAELGVHSDIERFVSPLSVEDAPKATAFITRENGILPNHPYHSASGDHVNANHLADAGLQFAHLVFGKPLYCVGGEMTFRHYVELGNPFTLTQLRVSKIQTFQSPSIKAAYTARTSRSALATRSHLQSAHRSDQTFPG